MRSFDTSRWPRRSLLVLLVVMVVIAAGCAGVRRWATLYNGPLNYSDTPSAIAVRGNGQTVVVTGNSYGVRTGQDYATVAYDAVTGAQKWVARYNDAGNGDDAATALALSPDGTKVFVTGSSESQPHTGVNYVTIAYDVDTGQQLWLTRDSRGGRANSVVVSPDGTKVFVAGNVGTIAYDAANGTERWFAGTGLFKLAISPDGTTVYGSGSGPSSNAFSDYLTVAYNAATGAQKWSTHYNGPGDRSDDVTALGVSPDGTKVFITGRSAGSMTGLDFATLAYNAVTGSQVWVSRYNGPVNADDGTYGLGVSPNGTQVFVTGYSWDTPDGNNGVSIATVAYDATTGSQRWATRYSGPDHVAVATGLAVAPDGAHVYVIGAASEDYATLSYNTVNGNQQWVARYNGPTNTGDFGTAIAVSPDAAKVFVTGFTNEFADQGFPPPNAPPPGPSQDYATVAYDAS